MYFSPEALTLFLSLVAPSIASPQPLIPRNTSPQVSKNGRCGAFAGGATCKASKFGPSCAWFGICGPRDSIFFSGWGCQSRYGDCGYAPPNGVQISTDGRCGAVSDKDFTCLGTKFGPCCSREGRCGGWEVCAKGGAWGLPSQSPRSTASGSGAVSTTTKTVVVSSTKFSTSTTALTTCTSGGTTSANLISTSQYTSSKSRAIATSQTSSGSISTTADSAFQTTSQYTSAKSRAPIISQTRFVGTTSSAFASSYSLTGSVGSSIQTALESVSSSHYSSASSAGFATSTISTSTLLSTPSQTAAIPTTSPGPTSTLSLSTGSVSTVTSTAVTTSSSIASSAVASQAGGYPVPTPGVAQPTNVYTGGIQGFSSGTPVSISNPSFENVASRKIRKRQSSAQQAAAAQGWTIQSCGSGTPSDCTFENYDAADGVWAFAGKNGGLVYQDSVNLLMGATYQFTFYYKVVSTYSGATSSSTGNWVVHSISLGDTTNTATANIAPVGSALVESGHDWAMQTLTVTNMQCQYAHFGKPQPDGSVAFRMFINAQASQNGGSQGSLGSFTWYLDQVRVQRMSDPPANYLQSSCGITPPSTATGTPTSATSTYTVTQTYQPTASVSILARNAVTNPNFESTAFTDYQRDANGGMLKAASWTASGCAQKQCTLNNGNGNPPACQSGTYCELWVAPAAWSQTITLVLGTTYWLSMWAMLTNAPAAAGGSVLSMTMEPVGATPGSGGVLLQAAMGANQGWTQYSGLVRVNRDFVVNVCGGAATDTSVSCQITIGGVYTGGWSAASGVKNYFDTVSVNATQTWTSSDR